ncbi:MAG TPA: serine/threonine-protein kinase [Polyangia bacterium]|jgi:tRNA A-37 threonylcarbamoyl transferase component Bud32
MEPESATDGRLEPGTDLNGTYEVVRWLFEGGMADIYEARHVRLTGQFAVKVLRHSLTAQHASAFDRFRREAEVTSSLRHPNIVQVLDFNQTPQGAAYFVMELLEGQNLRDHLETHGPMSLPDVVAVVEQVASALAAAHARGIVHRDLKPENIHMLPVAGRKEPFVKVLDFGISKVLAASTLTQESMLVGTPNYMAPEQARGGVEELDGRTDEFALGIIAHELLTGKRVFDAEAVVAIIFQVMSDDPPSLAPIAGEAVDQVIRKAVAKHRDDRYPNVALFAEALREAVYGPARGSVPMAVVSGRIPSGSAPIAAFPAMGSAAVPTPGLVTPPLTPAPTPRRRGRAIALALFLVAAAGFAGLAWKHQKGAPAWGEQTEKAQARAADLETVVRRLITAETNQLTASATRAGKVQNITNAVLGRVDDATFQDLLANEIWWSDFRAYGCVVLEHGQVKVAWHLPTLDLSPSELTRTLRPDASDTTARTAVVAGSAGPLLASIASVDGLKDGSIILVRPIDRTLVAQMASRANIVLLLSDGKTMLSTSIPENTIPDLERVVGREESHVLVDKRNERLAVAVSWTKGLWLWGLTGWAP